MQVLPASPFPHPPSRQGVAVAPGRRHKAPEFMSAADLEPIGFDIGKDPVFGEHKRIKFPQFVVRGKVGWERLGEV